MSGSPVVDAKEMGFVDGWESECIWRIN